MYLTLSEKRESIDRAFKESALVNMGDMPTDKVEADKYIEKAVENAGVFYQKYWQKDKDGKPVSFKWAIKDNLAAYVKEIVNDYMDSLELIYKKMF